MKNLFKMRAVVLFIIILVLTLVVINKFLIPLDLSLQTRKIVIIIYALVNIVVFSIFLSIERKIRKIERQNFKHPTSYLELNDRELKGHIRHLITLVSNNIVLCKEITEKLQYPHPVFLETKDCKDKVKLKVTVFNKKGKMVTVNAKKDSFKKY